MKEQKYRKIVKWKDRESMLPTFAGYFLGLVFGIFRSWKITLCGIGILIFAFVIDYFLQRKVYWRKI